MNIKRLLVACALGMMIIVPVHAEDKNTITLKGDLEGDYHCGSDVERIVLAGVKMDEGTVLEINSEAELVIADGTENHVGLISGKGMVDVTGGGTLNASGIMAFGYDMMFDHTGVININGSLTGMKADVTCNSGTINIICAMEGAAAISVVDGNVILNGGTLNVESVGIGVASMGELAINGGDIHVEAEAPAFMANEMSVADEVMPQGITVTKNTNGDSPYYTLADASDEEMKKAEISADASASKIEKSKEVFVQKAVEKKAERPVTAEPEQVDAKNETFTTVTIGLVGIGIVAAVVMTMIVMNRRRRR